MEDVLAYSILLSPLLLVPAFLQRRWSRRRAIAFLGLLTGALTALYGSIDWGGFVDANITRGWVTLYGIVVSGAALATGVLMFILNPPPPSNDPEVDRN